MSTASFTVISVVYVLLLIIIPHSEAELLDINRVISLSTKVVLADHCINTLIRHHTLDGGIPHSWRWKSREQLIPVDNEIPMPTKESDIYSLGRTIQEVCSAYNITQMLCPMLTLRCSDSYLKVSLPRD